MTPRLVRHCAALLGLLGCLAGGPRAAWAVCTGASPTWTAASAAQADVEACLASVTASGAEGDTIQIPAGSVAWAGPVALPTTRGVTLRGATIITCTGTLDALPPTTGPTCSVTNPGDGTDITCSTGHCLTVPHSQNHVITGVRLLYTGFGTTPIFHRVSGAGAQVAGKVQRVHHVSIEHTGPDFGSIDIFGEPTLSCNEAVAVHPTVLYDQSYFLDTRFDIAGTACSFGDGQAQHRLWFQDARPAKPTGTWPEILLVERSQFHASGTLINAMDCNYGGRYTFRFNSITGTPGQSGAYLEMHGEQGGNRACPWTEIYGNVKSGGADNFFGLAFKRSGSGVIFGNRVPATAQVMRLDDQRSWRTDISQCNGASAIDGNTPGLTGYPCRDQIGRIRDSSFTGDETAPQTERAPVYFWRNAAGAGTRGYDPVLHNTSGEMVAHLVENRDWYTEPATFTGAAGVGVGPLSARPATCTPDVGYWATDEGTWNTSGSGVQGQLYRCTAANTWTLYYVPFAFPHPLAAADVPPNSAPAVSIQAPAAPPTFTTGTSPLTTLAGTATDDTGVTSVTWANDRGGAGTATCGTCGASATAASWSVPSVALQPGANVLTVMAHDGGGLTATAVLTVTLTSVVPEESTTALLLPTNLVLVGHLNSCVASGAANAYACVLAQPLTAYLPRACYSMLATASNTAAVTVNLNNVGPIPLKTWQGGALIELPPGTIPVGKIIQMCYDGAVMQCQNCGP